MPTTRTPDCVSESVNQKTINPCWNKASSFPFFVDIKNWHVKQKRTWKNHNVTTAWLAGNTPCCPNSIHRMEMCKYRNPKKIGDWRIRSLVIGAVFSIYQVVYEALNWQGIWDWARKNTILTELWRKDLLIISALPLWTSYLYLVIHLELRKYIIIKITVMNSIVWKHNLFFRESTTPEQ